jgi:hypothetical protein
MSPSDRTSSASPILYHLAFAEGILLAARTRQLQQHEEQLLSTVQG